jgi:hypothetical protein
MASGFAFSYTRYGLVARPGALPAAGYLAGFANGAVFIYLSLTGFVLLLAPTGKLPSPRWPWWARVQVAALVVAFPTSALAPMPLYPEYPEIENPLGVAALANGPLTAAFPVGALLILAGLMAGPDRCCRGSAAPTDWSGCSCAGWPEERPWQQWRCWSP